MKKTPYLRSKQRHLSKFVLIWTVFLFILMLCGCAKTAPEAAADAALSQVGAVEQQIKKECPQAKIDKDMDALRATIKSQLSSCEAQIAKVEADKAKWQIACFAMLVLIGAWFVKKFKIL